MKRIVIALVIVALFVTTAAGSAAAAQPTSVADSPADRSDVDRLSPIGWFDGVGGDIFIGCNPKPEICGP